MLRGLQEPLVVVQQGNALGEGSSGAMVAKLGLGITGFVFLSMVVYLCDYRRRRYLHRRQAQVAAVRQEEESAIQEKERAKMIPQKLKTMKWAAINGRSRADTMATDTESSSEDEAEAVMDLDLEAAVDDTPENKAESKSQAVTDSETDVGTSSDERLQRGNSGCRSLCDDDDDDDEDCCYICLAPFNDDDEVAVSNNAGCRHFFHPECVSSWLLKHEECPVCRRNFLEEEETEEQPEETQPNNSDDNLIEGEEETQPNSSNDGSPYEADYHC